MFWNTALDIGLVIPGATFNNCRANLFEPETSSYQQQETAFNTQQNSVSSQSFRENEPYFICKSLDQFLGGPNVK